MRNNNIQHIYRWYDYASCEENMLISLCWSCAMEDTANVEHAETPDQSEELHCERCDAHNEQAAIWEREMQMYLSGAYDASAE